MKHYLLVGASSAVAQETKKQLLSEGCNVTQLSRNSAFSDAPLTDYLEQMPVFSEQFDGIVYFPGSINLKPFRSLKLEDFQSEFNIHFFGAVNVLKAYQNNLIEGSSVILFSSVAATTGMPFHAAVGSVKSAIEGLGRSLAAEWSPKVRVNVVAPSLTITPMAEKLTNSLEKIEAGAQRHPLKRLGDPVDLSNAVCFLLSEKSGWVTGQVLHIDGGMGTLKA